MSVSTHVILLGVPLTVGAVLFNGSLFSYHPVLMSASYLAAMGEAVLTARAAVSLKGKGTLSERSSLMLRHSLLQLLATLLAAAGFASIYVNKERMGKPHYTSWHGTIGLAVLLASAGVSLGGVLVYYRLIPSLKALGMVKKVHRTAGIAVFLSGAAAVSTGLKPMDPTHPVHRGSLTYIIVAACVMGTFGAAFARIPKVAGKTA